MPEATHIKIRQLEERIATSGLHMGGEARRRKLVPGEVVAVPHTETVRVAGEDVRLIDVLVNTGKVEIVQDFPTRPFEYTDYRQAELCSPDFRCDGPDDETEVAHALEAADKLLNTGQLDMPTQTADAPTAVPDGSRRGRRRANVKGAKDDAKVSTG